MKKSAGVWIDHKKAVVVVVTDKGDEVRVVVSNVDSARGHAAGDDGAVSERHLVPADDKRERRHTGQLNIYYDGVTAAIQAAGQLLIFGPGEAKTELKKRLKKKHPDIGIAAVESADKMTDRQVSAKVRRYFAT